MTNETTASQPTPHQNTLDAITGAIAYGRQGTNPPPSPEHWLAEYWSIGQQLAELGKTSAWDNVTPTASQPKSIGDDAQFFSWLDRLGDCGNREQFKQVSADFIAYIHEYFCAPAAQASATIQAAPETRSRVDKLLDAAFGVLQHDTGEQNEEYVFLRKALKERFTSVLRSAATIQEPVMVADPVGQAQTSGTPAAWVTPLRYGSQVTFYKPPKPEGWDDDEGEWTCEPLFRAAPMVADPAGVAFDREEFIRQVSVSVAEMDRDSPEGQPEMMLVTPDELQNTMRSVFDRFDEAATVKAVPSEALDEPSEREALIACLEDDAAKLADANPDDEMVRTMKEAAEMIKADGGINDLVESLRREKLVAPLLSNTAEYRACCDHPDCAICAGRGGFYRAAPLADKTGGGE